MKYNVDSSTSVDTSTGETGKKIYERFVFLRSVDNYEWMKGLGEPAILTMLFLVGEANSEGLLEFTPRVKRRVIKKLGTKERMMYLNVKKLKDRGLMKEIEPNYFQLAPFTAYKFHSRRMSEKIREYIDL